MKLSYIRTLTWPQALFIAAVVTLMISSAVQYITPKQAALQETLQTNYLGGKTVFSGVTYTGDIFSPPDQMVTGRITAQETDNLFFIRKIAKTFNLEQDTEQPLIWKSGNLYLTGGSKSFQLTLIDRTDFADTVTSIESAIPAAQSIADQLYENEPPTAIPDQVVFYTGVTNTHPEEVPPSQASIIEVPFTFSFEGYPIFVADTIFKPLTVMITEGDKLLKVTLTPETVSVEKGESYQTVSIPTALQQIEQNNGTVIAAEYGGHGTPIIESITQAIFTSVSIEYRADTVSDTVIPYYHFVGQLTNTENQTFTGHVITPAVQTDFSQR